MSPNSNDDTVPKIVNAALGVQCQYCLKEDVTLSKCAGCRIELYCSKECQRKAWPMHKVKCKMNRELRAKSNTTRDDDKAERLGDYTKSHGTVLAEAGIRALEVGIRPENAREQVLALMVHELPSSTRPELSYYVSDAEVVPIEIYGEKMASQFRQQLDVVVASRPNKTEGAFIVTLNDLENNVTNVSPTAYAESVTYDKPVPWKEWMLERMNQGLLQ